MELLFTRSPRYDDTQLSVVRNKQKITKHAKVTNTFHYALLRLYRYLTFIIVLYRYLTYIIVRKKTNLNAN